MRLRTVLIVVFAVVFGLAAAVGVYLVERPPQPEGPVIEMVPVLVAKMNVPRGHSLTADLIAQKKWPKDVVPEGALSEVQSAVDRTAIVPIASGEPLLDGKLAPRGAGRGLAAIIPPGMRAYTIQTPNIATGVAGFILPGNKVDVLLTVTNASFDDPTGGGSTVTLLQNVEILAVDQRITAPEENKMDPKELRSITLMVTPAGAAKLDLGQNKGTLHLALRNPEDQETGEVEPATLAGLRIGGAEEGGGPHVVKKPEPVVEAPLPPPPPPKQPAKIVTRIRTLRGSQGGFVTFESEAPESEAVETAKSREPPSAPVPNPP